MFFCTAVALEDNYDSDTTTGTYCLPEQVSFCYQWNMGISLRLESLMWHSVVSYYLKIYQQTGYDKERRSWHLKRRFPISQSCVRNANGDSFAFSTFLEQLDKKREGIYEKGFTKDSTQPHNHRRIAKRLVTKPSIISEEKKKKKICHLFWSLMVILFLSCRNLPRPESQTTMPNPLTSSKLLQFYL